MVKQYCILVIALFILPVSAAHGGELVIDVKGVKSKDGGQPKGNIVVDLWRRDSKVELFENFPAFTDLPAGKTNGSKGATSCDWKSGIVVCRKFVKVNGKTASVRYPNIPNGDYAVSLFHDANQNWNADPTPIGIPKEGYGISNNVTGIPDSTNAKISVKDSKNINITIIYR